MLVRAVDADSGYNAWLSYELQPVAGAARSPFRVGLYTGEISTTRVLDESDMPRQRLLVLVKDHDSKLLDVNVYLIIAICAVSSLLVLSRAVYTALRCSAAPTEGVCGQGKPVLVVLQRGGDLVILAAETAEGGQTRNLRGSHRAQDLGLALSELVPRLFRVASKDRGDLLEVNLQNGILFVNSRIDREALCGGAECSVASTWR
ncbi:hypothetical protein U0070_008392 [Myodes glareolus]|uniref:Cadherin domain-containing protein n=1 Tax=Myodes glareolus TaxID=447135 RepID=A0AAW0GY58_MYOGA